MPDDISSKIEEGDRVDHRLFGLGTATEVDGDKIEIDFDEKPGEIKRVLAVARRLRSPVGVNYDGR